MSRHAFLKSLAVLLAATALACPSLMRGSRKDYKAALLFMAVTAAEPGLCPPAVAAGQELVQFDVEMDHGKPKLVGKPHLFQAGSSGWEEPCEPMPGPTSGWVLALDEARGSVLSWAPLRLGAPVAVLEDWDPGTGRLTSSVPAFETRRSVTLPAGKGIRLAVLSPEGALLSVVRSTGRSR